MLELKTIARKIDHPLLTLPDVPAPAPAPSVASREPNQRRMMIVALALLLVALGLVLYRDRDFWFPDTSEAEDQLEPAPATAAPAQPAATISKAVTTEKPAERKILSAKAQPKVPAPVAAEAAAPVSQPPMSATTTRTVLPPLEVEVVAGDNHSTVRPGTNSVRVDLQRGSAPHPVQNASAAPTTATAAVTSNAAERVQMSAGAAEVVGQPAKPGYPMLARQMKVQGSVILQALIGKDGSIQDLHVVSGPPILATAAQEAVRQWRFKPHVENNEAVETQANITVNFTISTN